MNRAAKVVVVGDDGATLRVLTPWLTSLGYDTHGFDSGDEALAFLRIEGADVVITGSGLAGSRQLCASIRELPTERKPALLALRGTADVARTDAVDEVLAQPCPLGRVLDAVSRLVLR